MGSLTCGVAICAYGGRRPQPHVQWWWRADCREKLVWVAVCKLVTVVRQRRLVFRSAFVAAQLRMKAVVLCLLVVALTYVFGWCLPSIISLNRVLANIKLPRTHEDIIITQTAVIV